MFIHTEMYVALRLRVNTVDHELTSYLTCLVAQDKPQHDASFIHKAFMTVL